MVNDDVSGLEILSKVASILQELQQRGECSISELARAVDEPVSSTYRLVSSLRSLGWLESTPQRGWVRLGLGLMHIGTLVEEQRNLMDIATPRLRQLRDETRLTSYLLVRNGAHAICVSRYDGREVRNLALDLGGMLPLDRGGAAPALLAQLPQEEQVAILDTLERSPAEMKATLEALEIIAREGIAVSDGDVTEGIAAVGAAVFNRRGEPVAAVSVSGMRRVALEDDAPALAVRATASAISRALGWSGERHG